jgi:sugar phosphate isomerase/epimerase
LLERSGSSDIFAVMTIRRHFCRRRFLSLAAAAVPAFMAAPRAIGAPYRRQNAGPIPVGIELYSVRDELANNLEATVTAVARMGYEVVEFYSPYYQWTPEYARSVKSLMDGLGIECRSTHNSADSFTPEGVEKAIELNRIIGSGHIVMASPPRVTGVDGWMSVADMLNETADRLRPLGMKAGFHNHAAEWAEVEGGRSAMDILAANTADDITLQLDVGTAVAAGADPVAWIRANPGRIRHIHCKDWGPGEGNGYRVLFGEGSSPWLDIFEAAEEVGRVEFYLIEQEGSRFSSMDTAERCLQTYNEMRA